MIIITIEVDAPESWAQAIKESLAMDLEKYGDTRVVSVEAIEPQQLSLQ